MNLIFSCILIASLVLMTFISPENALNSLINGVSKATTFSIEMIAIYSLWLSLIDIMEKCGVLIFFKNIFSPLLNRIYKNTIEEEKKLLTLNFTSNFLGMSNASTPSGIEAMRLISKNSNKINENIANFMVLNTTCPQLLPTTIIGLRIIHKSTSPNSIILPTILTSISITLIGLFLSKIINKIKVKNENI